jgi:hypothetical protein
VKRLRRYVVGFDTEDDGNGNPFLWAFVHAHGSVWCRTREEAQEVMLALVRKWKPRGYQVEVWATNLEYDMHNTFTLDQVASVAWHFGKSYLCAARWRGVEFRDTTRFLPVSVETLGEFLGIKKVHARMFADPKRRPSPETHWEMYRARCVRDASITYHAAKFLHETARGFKVHARSTLASTALAIWKERFWKRNVVRPVPEVWNAAHAAYHGGRTQAFAAGTFGPVTILDVASMFPWAMTSAPLPLPWGLVSHARKGATILPNGVYLVDVTSRLDYPQLPVRTDHGTIYPNGKWRAWYVGEELLAFLEHAGARAHVVRGYVFQESVRPFDGYVRTLFRRKSRARGLRREMFKRLLTGLYGKFGQGGAKVRAIPVSRFLTLDSAPVRARHWHGLVLYTQETMPPPWGNDVWPAFVTARARVRLAREMQRVRDRGGRVLYCDTDSIFYTGPGGRYATKAARIGDFELRGTRRRMLIVGKKEYALETSPGRWESHVKGVPLLQRYAYLMEGEASFERPTKMREAAVTGNRVNAWRTIKKVRRVDLRNGAMLPDGTLPAPWIDHAPQ